MSEQKSVMVVATRYQLLVKDTETVERAQLGAYLISGQKKALSTPKAINRGYAEARNAEPNNEYWEIDEEATKEFYRIREENLKEKARRGDAKKVTTDDIVMSLLDKIGGKQAAAPKKEEPVKKEAVVDPIEEEVETVVEETPQNEENLKEAPKEEEVSVKEEETPAPKVKYKRMNKTELKAELDEREIEYDPEASNAKLVELLEENDEEAAKEGGES